MKPSLLLIFSLVFSFSCSTNHLKKQNTHTYHPAFGKYLRSDWNHWIDTNGDCIDTRGEILKTRSLAAVQMNTKGCKVKSGKWMDYYYPEIHTLASKVDIDHLIPLKHAHDVGGANWSFSQKEAFANDLENLVITNLKYNRQKGAKGIDEWLPRHKEYACKYVSDWIKIKKKYSLRLRETETNSINSLKSECSF